MGFGGGSSSDGGGEKKKPEPSPANQIAQPTPRKNEPVKRYEEEDSTSLLNPEAGNKKRKRTGTGGSLLQ